MSRGKRTFFLRGRRGIRTPGEKKEAVPETCIFMPILHQACARYPAFARV